MRRCGVPGRAGQGAANGTACPQQSHGGHDPRRLRCMPARTGTCRCNAYNELLSSISTDSNREGIMPEPRERWLQDIKPTIENQEEVLIAGCPQYGNPEDICPGSAWERLLEVRKEIGLPESEDIGYGVEVYPPGFDPDDPEFYYFAGFGATSETRGYPGLFLYNLPACRIAVFTLPDNDHSKLPALFDYAYSSWLPESGYELSHGFDFERYVNTGDGKIQVCIPVVRTE